MRPDASLLVTIGIPLIGLAAGAALLLGVQRAARARGTVVAAAVVVFGWTVAAAVLALSGVLARFDARPPPLALFFVGTLVVGVVLGSSRIGAALSTLPLPVLVGFHAFRLPLELVMHQAAREGTMPAQLSFGGCNFDIVTGLSALVLALLLTRRELPRVLVLAWNVFGALLLAGVVAIAFLSTPIFHAFGTRPDELNTWVAYFPFVYLALAVMSALVGHLVLFRRLAAPEVRTAVTVGR